MTLKRPWAISFICIWACLKRLCRRHISLRHFDTGLNSSVCRDFRISDFSEHRALPSLPFTLHERTANYFSDTVWILLNILRFICPMTFSNPFCILAIPYDAHAAWPNFTLFLLLLLFFFFFFFFFFLHF